MTILYVYRDKNIFEANFTITSTYKPLQKLWLALCLYYDRPSILGRDGPYKLVDKANAYVSPYEYHLELYVTWKKKRGLGMKSM